jgi:hypothetical protein
MLKRRIWETFFSWVLLVTTMMVLLAIEVVFRRRLWEMPGASIFFDVVFGPVEAVAGESVSKQVSKLKEHIMNTS